MSLIIGFFVRILYFDFRIEFNFTSVLLTFTLVFLLILMVFCILLKCINKKTRNFTILLISLENSRENTSQLILTD